MEVRRKLTLQFLFIVAVILTIAEIAIYISSEHFWREDFYSRLYGKASAVAKLLIDVEGVDPKLLELIEQNNVAILPYEEILIFDHHGQQMLATRVPANLKVGRELLNRIRIEKTVEQQQGKYKVLGFLYTGRYDRIVVVAGAIDVFGQRKLANLRNILLIVFVASMIIIFISGRIYSNRALSPILDVISEVTAIDERHLHLRVNEGNGKDEIARLAGTFNRMLDRLESAFKTQKHFIANASHELRTPLAYIMGRLEVAAQRNRTSEEYRETILSAIDDMKLLNQSTNKLLLLAQSSADSPDISFHPVRIDEVIWEARTEVMKQAEGYRVDVDFSDVNEDMEGLKVSGNDMLLKTAFINLMENGCKYSDNKTTMVSIEKTDGKVFVHFSDDGIGIPENEFDMIFEPFFRSKHCHGREGHGLGLALVRQIVQLHKGSVTVRSALNEGSVFSVSIPVNVL